MKYLKTILGVIFLTILFVVGFTWGNNHPAQLGGVNWVLPNYKLTPGLADPRLTESVICASSFRTGNYRNVSDSEKTQVYALYGIKSHKQGQFEIDHLIAITDGGSSDIKNLWPQPAIPKPGFHEKDVFEVWVHNQICSAKMTLKQGQDCLIHFDKCYPKMLKDKNLSSMESSNFTGLEGEIE
jgi:hypothetical protein